MSRIGKKPIPIPDGVKVNVAEREITVEGKLGKLVWTHRPEVTVEVDAAAQGSRRHAQERRARCRRLARADPRAHSQHGRGRVDGLREEARDPGRRLPGRGAEGRAAASRRVRQRSSQEDSGGAHRDLPRSDACRDQGDRRKRSASSPPKCGPSASRSRTRARAFATTANKCAARRARQRSKASLSDRQLFGDADEHLHHSNLADQPIRTSESLRASMEHAKALGRQRQRRQFRVRKHCAARPSGRG